MATKPRLIDRLPPPSHPKQMQVICPGAPRSGSSSLGLALKMLGYTVHAGMGHNFAVHNLFPQWTEAIEAKYNGKGKPYSAEDFHKLLGSYEAISGLPAAVFAEELIAAYPDAQVVVTERDPDDWVGSWNRTVCKVNQWWQPWRWLLPLCGGVIRDFRRNADAWFPAWSYGHPLDRAEQRKHYLDHYQRIYAIVPKERLLVLRPGDGFERLCEFLGREVPKDAEYPHLVNGDGFTKSMNRVWRMAVLQAARNVGIATGIAGLSVWLMLRLHAGYMLLFLTDRLGTQYRS